MKDIIFNASTGQATVVESEATEMPSYSTEDYESLVNSKIKERYTSSQEFAILRQKEEKPEEWQQYYDYCEACKQEVRNKPL